MLLGLYASNFRLGVQVRVPRSTGRVLASCHNVRPLVLSLQTRNILLSRGRINPFLIQNSRWYATSETPVKKASGISRFLPSAFQPAPGSGSSLRKIVALAKPEKKPLLLAVGLLLVSSSVAMSVPFTIGKLIDFFSSANPVSGQASAWV
jgi:putative ABC transport system ATP-binding protein